MEDSIRMAKLPADKPSKNRFTVITSPVTWFLLCLVMIGVVTAIAPAEQSLGTHVRVVYLHGAWVWAGLAAFLAAAGVGLVGLAARRQELHLWSRALGRTGILFWITYLPISMWAMQANWNGLFLAEPRWRYAVTFAVGGLLLQIGLTLLENPAWASAANLVFAAILLFTLQGTPNVMHPAAPIVQSDAPHIQLYFAVLVGLTLLAAWQVARGWRSLE
jgi:hypothetical protein